MSVCQEKLAFNAYVIINFICQYLPMRKVLAVASVTIQHKELVFKDLKSIFKRIKISIETLLQEEIIEPDSSILDSGSLFKSYPYITLTIPNYQCHREYLQKIYKNNVLFNKFILLISQGETYEELVNNGNEEILREQCRNWNNVVSCSFDSTPIFTQMEQQVSKMNMVLGQMDIRGKISQIGAKKKFHLIQDHVSQLPNNPNPKHLMPRDTSLLKLFFGLEVGCGRKGCGNVIGSAAASIASAYYSSIDQEFKEFCEDDKDNMMDEEVTQSNQKIAIVNNQQIIRGARWNNRRAKPQPQVVKARGIKRHAKRRFEQNLAPVAHLGKNPYLKKKYVEEIVLSHGKASEMNS